MHSSDSPFVRGFRASSPYIHAHRGRTFVLSFGGDLAGDARFAALAHDFALLNILGIRLVLVHGIRPQIEERLALRGVTSRMHRELRITDAVALQCVKEAAGLVRVEIEALLSMGVTNAPSTSARIHVSTGNFLTARPVGVLDGVDYQHTGAVRRVDAGAIRAHLDLGNIVLLSPVGYSPTGETFNLSAEEVATEVAVALGADKLLVLLSDRGLADTGAHIPAHLTTDEACALLDAPSADAVAARHIAQAVRACRHGVPRVHLIADALRGTVLEELFTREGRGTLISQAPFESLRPAVLGDVGGILELIAPLEAAGVLTRRTRERLEMEIADYAVIERDGSVISCVGVHANAGERMAEVACLAVHEEYRGARRGGRLLEYAEERARACGCACLFALSTQTAQWFIERGFQPAHPEDLPPARRAVIEPGRNSRVLVKAL